MNQLERPIIMVRLWHNLGWSLLLACGLCLALTESPAQTPAPVNTTPAVGAHPQPTHHHAKKAAPVVEAPAPAPIPLMPEQMAPTPPHVTYQNGLLTIDAKNSTLSQVLHSVQAQTGASIEMPASASNDRVMLQLGPGQPRDILNTLLNGSKFNYIILGMTGDPGRVQKVILTTRQNAPAAVNTAQNNSPGPQPQAEEPQDEDMPPEPEAENPPENQPTMPGRFRPGQVPVRSPDTNEPPQQNGNQLNGGKTPEQLLQELQNMQEQQQRYQQQLNPANVEGQPPQPQ